MEVIYLTRLEAFPNAWRDRTARPLDYHLGCIGTGADFDYSDPSVRRKINAQTVTSRAETNRVVPIYVPVRWLHVDNYIPRTRWDASYDYVPVHVDISNNWIGYTNIMRTLVL